jgi:hypothetical protein
VTECEHDWSWGRGRNAGSAECRKCRTWQPASLIAFDLRAQMDAARLALAELHEMAIRHNPRSPTPEQAAEHRRKHEETIARLGADVAWENVVRALGIREPLSESERSRLEALWDEWDAARDPHEKAKLQMRLGESVASWMQHAEAVERERDHLRKFYEHSMAQAAELERAIDEDAGGGE